MSSRVRPWMPPGSGPIFAQEPPPLAVRPLPSRDETLHRRPPLATGGGPIPVWARISILFGIILELPLSIEWGPLVKVGQGHIGVDVLVFKRHDVVDGSVGRIPGGLARPQFPAEARTE